MQAGLAPIRLSRIVTIVSNQAVKAMLSCSKGVVLQCGNCAVPAFYALARLGTSCKNNEWQVHFHPLSACFGRLAPLQSRCHARIDVAMDQIPVEKRFHNEQA
jgi:hypothetical protein